MQAVLEKWHILKYCFQYGQQKSVSDVAGIVLRRVGGHLNDVGVRGKHVLCFGRDRGCE